MTTGGGLVCHGRKDGQFVFLDSATGEQIHSIEVGQNMASSAMSYKVDGEQYIAIMADDAKATGDGVAIESAGENGRVLAFKLGGGAVIRGGARGHRAASLTPPIERFGDPDQVELGRNLFERHCAICHVEGGRALDLTTMNADAHGSFQGIVIGGQLSDRGMKSFRAVLSWEDAQAIHAYLTDLAWEHYEKRSSHEK
jgi:hypothetical protein